MAQCRSCQQIIDWVKTEAGKNMPVDPEYVWWDEADDKTVLVTESGKVVTVDSRQSQPNMKGRISHFATCPEANKWRQKK